QVDIQLQQPWRLLQRLAQQLHRFMLWLVCWAAHALACHPTLQVQHEAFFKPLERFGPSLGAVPHARVLTGDAPIRGHMLLDALASRATHRVWFGVLRDNLGETVYDG